MKPARSNRNENASILLAGLISTAIIGFTICSYLLLVSAQHATVVRSQSWNGALTMAEAGVEEAMAHLNSRLGKVGTTPPNDEWKQSASGSFSLPIRTLGSGSYQVSYVSGSAPLIFSTGRVAVADSSTKMARAIQATTQPVPLFNAAIAVLQGIDVRKTGLTADSFDSANPMLSSQGLYSAAHRASNGAVACLAGTASIPDSVINGKLLLGPSATYTPNRAALVSDTLSRDLSLNLPEVDVSSIPWTTGLSHAQVTYDEDGDSIVRYTFPSSGNFELTALNAEVFVGAGALVRLKVTGASSPGAIHISSDGVQSGKLEIYMGGSVFTWKGSVQIDNGNPMQLAYFGLPGNSAVDFSAISSFTGTVFASNAQLTMGNKKGPRFSYVGSCIGKSLTTLGGCDFHFDQNLQRKGPMMGWTIAQWKEL